MIDSEVIRQRIRQAFDAIYHQRGRLLRIESTLGQDALVVEQFHGREALSECFAFEIDCIAPSAHFELKRLIGQPLTLRLATATGNSRVWHALTQRAAFLGADGGVARYRVRLVPWLSLLQIRRDCRIFQDLTALEIIERVFSGYAQADFRVDVTQSLPRRPRCTQYRETDLAFVERLLAEEGLCYRFEHAADRSAADDNADKPLGPTLVIFDAQAETPTVEPATIRFHRVSPTETSDTISSFRRQARLAPNTTTLSAWDALKVRAHADAAEAPARPNVPPLEIYDGSRSALRYRDADTVRSNTEQTLDALQGQNDLAYGTSSARQLSAGSRFDLTEHPTDDGSFRLWTVEHRAANNLGAHLAHLLGNADIEFGSYRNHFICVPTHTAQRPTYIHKPTAPGPESALVVGVAGQSLTSQRDHSIKVQFPWQRGEKPNAGGLSTEAADNGNAPGNERSGIWVRIAEPLAGPNWGASFTPRVGTEVLVDYLEGDIDQPMIVGQFHNGSDAPPFSAGTDSAANHPGTLSGTHSYALDRSGHNQWVHDDAPGQLRQRLATSQAESELNLGYLIEQNGANRGRYRGQGSELRTRGWAALRAPQGLLFSASTRERAQSASHDVSEAAGQLKAAGDLASRLSETAANQQASALQANKAQQAFITAIDATQGGRYTAPVGGQSHKKDQAGQRQPDTAADRLGEPFSVFEGPSALISTTPASSLYYAGGNTHTSVQGESQHTAGATYSSVAGATSSLYTHDGGIQGVAANGALTLQAHDDAMEILADDAVTVTSSQTRVDIQASKKIVLAAGQSTITLDGANITFACPGSFTVHGSTHDFSGAAQGDYTQVVLPSGTATSGET